VAILPAAQRSPGSLFRATFDHWLNDHGPRLAAALAYYSLFSLAPLLMIAMAVAGATLGRQAAEAALELRFYGLVGRTGAQVIQGILQEAHRPGRGTITGLLGGALLLLGASAIFVELQDAFNTIWHTESKIGSFWHLVLGRIFSFGLVLIAEILLIVSVLATAGKTALVRLLPEGFWASVASTHIPGMILSLSVATVLFAMMFKLLPKTKILWRDVWPAALVTAVMFNLGKLVIGLYLRHSNLISAYGAAKSLAAVVGWTYYSSMILYFGAELAKVYTEVYGSRSSRRVMGRSRNQSTHSVTAE
jgi:membrane protein